MQKHKHIHLLLNPCLGPAIQYNRMKLYIAILLITCFYSVFHELNDLICRHNPGHAWENSVH
mgnify:CR=1 FL=1